MKEAYDVRGRQGSLLRLLGFDIEAFLHVVIYRVLIFASVIIGGTVLLTTLFFPQYLQTQYVEALVLVVWVLFTLQVYETAKAGMLILSKGISSPDLNRSFVNFSSRKSRIGWLYSIIPPAAVLAWVIGFAALLAMWFA